MPGRIVPDKTCAVISSMSGVRGIKIAWLDCQQYENNNIAHIDAGHHLWKNTRLVNDYVHLLH